MMAISNIGWLYYKYYYSELYQAEPGKKPDFKFDKKNKLIFKQKLENHRTDLFELDSEGTQSFIVRTEYPGLITGTGITHDFPHEDALKLGFSFDHTTGLPYLPGSSVKGMLRAYFPSRLRENHTEKAEAMEDYLMSILPERVQALTNSIPNIIDLIEAAMFEGYDVSGGQKDNNKRLSLYKRDIFFDAYPQSSRFIGDGSDKDSGRFLGEGVITPHGTNPLKDPTPIKFLKILPKVSFVFQFKLQPFVLNNETILEASDKLMLFRTLLMQFGIGAKTNVGFGRMEEV